MARSMLASSRMLSTSPSAAGATCARRPNRDAQPDLRRCRQRWRRNRSRRPHRTQSRRRWRVHSFGHCRTRRRRLHPQTHRGAGQPSHRQPARPVRNGSATHCTCLPAMRRVRRLAGNLFGPHLRGMPAHTGNRPRQPLRRRRRHTLRGRRGQRRARPSQPRVQGSLQLPGQLQPYTHGDSHAFVSSRTPLHLPGRRLVLRGGFCPLHYQYEPGPRFLARDFKSFFQAIKRRSGLDCASHTASRHCDDAGRKHARQDRPCLIIVFSAPNSSYIPRNFRMSGSAIWGAFSSRRSRAATTHLSRPSRTMPTRSASRCASTKS